MQIEQIPLDQIDLPEWECKEFDEIRFKKLCAMIKKHGQLRTVCVMQRNPSELITGDLRPYIVLEGRNIIKAMLHEKHLVCWAHNVGVIETLTAAEVSLVLNELEFQTDFVSVADLVKKVVVDSHVNNAVNHSMFDQREVKKFMKILEFDWEEFNRAKQSGKMSLFEHDLGVKEDATDETLVEEEHEDDEQAYRPNGKLEFKGYTWDEAVAKFGTTDGLKLRQLIEIESKMTEESEFDRITHNPIKSREEYYAMEESQGAVNYEQPDPRNYELPF